MSADHRIPEAGHRTGPATGPHTDPIFSLTNECAVEPWMAPALFPAWAAEPASGPASRPVSGPASGQAPKPAPPPAPATASRIDSQLAARTAEAMALPLMVCRRRSCRRGQRCRWRFLASEEPCCLQNLDAAQREIFDELYQAAKYASSFLGSNTEQFETPHGERRIGDETAIAIARGHAHRWSPAAWDAARRARQKRLPPVED